MAPLLKMTNSIVIASYRYGHLASQAIESVLGQSQPFDSIWFVDDGVGDCKHLPQIYPEVNYVFREKNLGTVANFQDMLMRVRTARCMFLGADNWLREDTLAQLSKSNADIVTYDIMVVGEKKNEILQRHPDEVNKKEGSWYWDRSGGHHGSMLYNTKIAQKCGYSSPPGRTLEDQVLYNKMLAHGAVREHIALPLLYYRRHRENYNPC